MRLCLLSPLGSRPGLKKVIRRPSSAVGHRPTIFAARIPVQCVDGRHYFLSTSRQKCGLNCICDLKVWKRRLGKSLSITQSTSTSFLFNSGRADDEIRLCYCVFESKNNISDWLLLHEQCHCFSKNLVISCFFICKGQAQQK